MGYRLNNQAKKAYLYPVETKVYRPQEVQDAVQWQLTDEQREIPQSEIDELGVGIRINKDGNDGGNENDLIRLDIDLSGIPSDVLDELDIIIKTPTQLKVWANIDATGEIAAGGAESTMPDEFKSQGTYWVECTDELTSGDVEIYIKPKQATDKSLIKTIPFRSFKSLVIALSGEDSIFFTVEKDGMFGISKNLYLEGYNVIYYDEDEVGNQGEGVVFDEIKSQVKEAAISSLGIFGYSHGGGSTYNLSNLLNSNRGSIGSFSIDYTGYVDAIKENNITSEDRFPASSQYLINYYQRSLLELLKGNVVDHSLAENINVSDLGLELSHISIGTDSTVRQGIENKVKNKITP